jgi:hypothetical protein
MVYLCTTPAAGVGVFAARDIREGEVILKERPFFCHGREGLNFEVAPAELPPPYRYTTLAGEDAFFLADSRMLLALQSYAQAPDAVRQKLLALYRPSEESNLQSAPMSVVALQMARACWGLSWCVSAHPPSRSSPILSFSFSFSPSLSLPLSPPSLSSLHPSHTYISGYLLQRQLHKNTILHSFARDIISRT